jgi:DNA-nicking Smr family endonuclease
MRPKKPSFIFKSFQELKAILDTKSLPDYKPTVTKEHRKKPSPDLEEELFKKAMDGVTPIMEKKQIEKISKIELPEGFMKKEDAETLKKLEDLVKYGKGFNVSDTPEYIEGTGYHIHPEIARRLHRGDYSIQAFVDLHGLLVEDAKEVFEKFLKRAVTIGKTGVLIIHGRGLSSPCEPILKNKVIEWLTRGPWRKWVVAYSSARKCDGGAGATYVLLRRRPVSKRFKIRRSGVGKA